jgi:uncharacterized repeat protein (TIGR03803 family)
MPIAKMQVTKMIISKITKITFFTILPLVALAIAVTLSTPVAAQQETTLLDLNYNGHIGGGSLATLVRDAAGNLYGTSAVGGYRNGGTVFKMEPAQNGTWTVKLLHAFLTGLHDGQRMQAGVILDAAGNLYGTTFWGGDYNQGTVFELMPQADGTYKEKRLHSFGGVTDDGQEPQSTVVFDKDGNLYGTTWIGGKYGDGVTYQLKPQADGTWTEKILHAFDDNFTDGYTPISGVILDSAGNVYGTTNGGGTGGVGTVYELSPTPEGWKETILHNFLFNQVDGTAPKGLVFDTVGNLYGTTQYGGIYGGTGGEGTVFELSPNGDGSWTETILHDFNEATGDGRIPYAALIFDAAGNLYGTTSFGGANGWGTVFELSPASGGGWTETVLYSFGLPSSGDGESPLGALIFDPAGNLYGTTDEGGAYGYGTVFELTH